MRRIEGLIRSLMLGLIRAYQLSLSALIGRTCRHLPTCSDYAADAIRRHGPWRGAWLAAARLSRCHPFGTSGFDPVPETLEPAGWRLWHYGRWSWRDRSAEQQKGPRP